MSNLIGDNLQRTEPAYGDMVFDDTYRLERGELAFEIVHPGPTYTPGGSFVWVPARSSMFSGDIVYVEQILAVGEQSSITDRPAARAAEQNRVRR